MSDFELVTLSFDEVEVSDGFAGWMADEHVSIAITKGSALCLIGLRRDGSVSIVDRAFAGAIGLASPNVDTLFLVSRYQIWRLENAVPAGMLTDDGHDRLYLPQTGWTTGMLLIRDLAAAPDGQVIFVNGMFSCLSIPSERLNFEPVWMPPFISELAPQDRCHLSGVALEGARPVYVTSASGADEPGGWRAHQADGGLVLSVQTGEVIAAGFSMPCSPVIQDGRLWLCLGGSGELATIDLFDGSVTQVAALPGFARGLAFAGHHAVVGVSRPAHGESFDGLPLADRLSRRDAAGRCGVFVIDTRSGQIEHWLTFAGGPSEIHAVAVLPGVRSPTAVRFAGQGVEELVTIPKAAGDLGPV